MSVEALILQYMVNNVIERELEEAKRRIHNELMRQLILINQLRKVITGGGEASERRNVYTARAAGEEAPKVRVELL